MGDDLVGFLVLADTASSVQQFVSVFVGVYVLLILAFIVTSWFPDEPDGAYAPRVLSNESLDLAVAHGAAYYGVVRRGGG